MLFDKSFNPRKTLIRSPEQTPIMLPNLLAARINERDLIDGGSEASIIAAVGEIIIAAIRVWRHTSRFVVNRTRHWLTCSLNEKRGRGRGRKTRSHNTDGVSGIDRPESINFASETNFITRLQRCPTVVLVFSQYFWKLTSAKLFHRSPSNEGDIKFCHKKSHLYYVKTSKNCCFCCNNR